MEVNLAALWDWNTLQNYGSGRKVVANNPLSSFSVTITKLITLDVPTVLIGSYQYLFTYLSVNAVHGSLYESR